MISNNDIVYNETQAGVRSILKKVELVMHFIHENYSAIVPSDQIRSS